MDAEWIKSPTARRILMHWGDSRPAWLWSPDGVKLLWRNSAARFFHGRIKKSGVKLAPDAVPIKGQIARLIRLGSPGRSSLSRIQFLAGDRPISTTCTSTPIALENGQIGLLLVGVDPIEPELLEAPTRLSHDSVAERLFPAGADYLLIDDDGQIRDGSPVAIARYAPVLESEGLPELPASGSGEVEFEGRKLILTRYTASPQDATLLLFETEASQRPVETTTPATIEAPAPIAPESDEPLLPIGLPAEDFAEPSPGRPDDNWVELFVPPPETGLPLSSLFDRLADDAGLYTQLTESDEVFVAPRQVSDDEITITGDASNEVEQPVAPVAEAEPPLAEVAPETPPADIAPEPDVIAAVIEFADDPELADSAPEQAPTAWRVIGRSFAAIDTSADDALNAAPESPVAPPLETEVTTIDLTNDSAAAERVSRYNFDELSRILTDRVGGDAQARPTQNRPEPPVDIETPIAPVRAPSPLSYEGVINPNAETFVLNRLPLGILVFRDQQVLFANRALTDLTGHDSVERLRAAGIASIFPSEDGASAGPVAQLVRRDSTLLPVNARLQSITWQGRPALMLCANPTTPQLGHEGAVRSFAELMAESRSEGFIAADRAGIVTRCSALAQSALGGSDLVGKPLAELVVADHLTQLREFLERPARFAETARPHLTVNSAGGALTIFAEGQAGIVSGYFALLQPRKPAAQPAPVPQGIEVEASVLGRLSRGVRRPLNTIIGFADLIQSAAFGNIENQRYLDYARDIKTSGQEISMLVDELDDFTRLKDGRYAARPADVDLWALLDSCMVRVKSQAGAARVLVRSAISEHLPRIHADRASLGQAVLNLLASAIDQTPAGGSVILSAQLEDDGSIGIHVRDGAIVNSDFGERFVVFRDGVGRDGEVLMPVRSSVGLALTRSLLAVNTCSLSVDPSGGVGTLFSLLIPSDLVVPS